MTPDEMVGAALTVAQAGLAAGDEKFRRWCETTVDSPMRRWAETLLDPLGEGNASDS